MYVLHYFSLNTLSPTFIRLSHSYSGITLDTINALEVTTTNLLAYVSNTPALSSFLEEHLIEILYALATIQDDIPLEESTSELL